MQYFRHEHEGKKITLYPLVCWHLGAEQSDEEFIKEHVQRIADDPDGRWIYLGDGGECVTKASKGEIYLQKYGPTRQLQHFVELAKPIAGKGLFGIKGNHDRRIERDSGLDWTAMLCAQLGVPFLGNAALMELRVRTNPETAPCTYHVFCHHGVDSGANTGTKVNAAQKLEKLVEADAVLSAHSHACLAVPPSYIARIGRKGIEYRAVESFVCGCAYDSRVPGYAEEKGYSPIIPAHIGVTFKGNTSHDKTPVQNKHISHQIWRAAA